MTDFRSDFPIYTSHPELVYLDSAATTLKPQKVLDKVDEYYREYSSNIHRGLYPIAEKANAEYEHARHLISQFINASSDSEIVFTKGATESLNLLATTLSEIVIKPGTEVLSTIVEHHANFVPWQQAAIKRKAKFGVVTFNPLKHSQKEILEIFRLSISKETAILAFAYVSNVLGVVLPAQEIIAIARGINPNILIVLDVCQAIQHKPVDVQTLDCDFLVFSGHKCFGPTGIGVLYGKKTKLSSLPAYQFGGDMIEEVTVESTRFTEIPHRFEAGTPPIAQAIGLGVALEYISSIGLSKVSHHIRNLRTYAVKELQETFGEGIIIYDNLSLPQTGIIAFNLSGCHPHDVAQIAGEHNVCIRVGHHCAQPLHTYLDIPASCRISLSIYNTVQDIDLAITQLENVLEVLHPSAR